jgi:hypothetical protein
LPILVAIGCTVAFRAFFIFYFSVLRLAHSLNGTPWKDAQWLKRRGFTQGCVFWGLLYHGTSHGKEDAALRVLYK